MQPKRISVDTPATSDEAYGRNDPAKTTSTVTYAKDCCNQKPDVSKKEREEKPLPRFARPEWVIVYVTIVYAWFTRRTLIAINRQADTMDSQLADARKQSAESSQTTQSMLEAYVRQAASMENQSALLRQQIETGIQKERARLNIQLQPIFIDCPASPEEPLNMNDTQGFSIRSCLELTNSGHSNAFIKDGALRFVLTITGASPIAQVSPDDFEPFSKTITPSEDTVYCPIDSDSVYLSINQFAQDLADGSRTLYLYGFIEYESVGILWKREFGYAWSVGEYADPPEPDIVVGRSMKHPDRLNVMGDWQVSLLHKNAEYRQAKPIKTLFSKNV